MTPVQKALNKLAKWRTVFVGWQLGTRSDTDPEAQALKDHRETTILLRAEVNALVQLLVAKNVFTADEFNTQLIEEAEILDAHYQKAFPGFRSSDTGMVLNAAIAADTTRHWKP